MKTKEIIIELTTYLLNLTLDFDVLFFVLFIPIVLFVLEIVLHKTTKTIPATKVLNRGLRLITIYSLTLLSLNKLFFPYPVIITTALCFALGLFTPPEIL